LKGSQRMHKRGLEGIFSLVPVAQVIGAVREDAVSMALVERVDSQRAWRWSGSLDAGSTTD
jgi:hypothetical protein